MFIDFVNKSVTCHRLKAVTLFEKKLIFLKDSDEVYLSSMLFSCFFAAHPVWPEQPAGGCL